jgi:putative DNA primase/helicase
MALADLHGDYYRHAGVKTFLQGAAPQGGAEHRSDLVRLRGDIRFVTCDEPKAALDLGWRDHQANHRQPHHRPRVANERTEVTYKPRFKLHSECNVIPRAPSDDKGFRRRFKLYQWRVSLSDTAEGEMPIDPCSTASRPKSRASSIGSSRARCTGSKRARSRNLKAMAEVLQDFWADSSPLLEWMNEWCDTSDPEAREPSSASLYDHFKKWNEDAGREQVMSSTAFGRALLNKQFKSVKDRKGRRWRKGLKLREQGMFGEFAPEPAMRRWG